jgi:hypothetical protein
MISTAYSPTSFNGDGVTTAFPITWDINASSEVVVTEVIIATGVETIKTLTTHYTVAGTGPFTVTAVTAPAGTVRWVISRAVAKTQLTDYTLFDAFPADTHEDALDKLTLLAQDNAGGFNRALRQPNGDATAIDYLPSKITRASQYLGFDSDGDPVALAAPANTTAVSAFVATLLDDTTLLAFEQTLGLVAATAWTPVLTAATPGNLAITYSTQTGVRWHFARLNVAWFDIVTSSFTHTTASGDARITGLPGTPLANIGGMMQRFGGVTKANYTQYAAELDIATNIITVTCSGSAQVNSPLAITQIPSAGSVRLTGYVIYYSAS